MPIQHTSRISRAALGLAIVSGLALPACRGDRSDKPPRQFLPDMDDSPKWKPQVRSQFFTDGRSMRQPVAGAVPFGSSANPQDPDRPRYMKDEGPFFTGKNARGDVVPTMPDGAIDHFVALAKPEGDDAARRTAGLAAMLERGGERFNIYCAPCHGFDGKGQGTVGLRLSIAPANLHEDKFRRPPAGSGPSAQTASNGDGHIFDVVRNGWNKGNMPGYAHALDEHDSWAVVLYVRALQASTAGSLEAVPEAVRAKLQQTRPPAAPPAGAAPAAPAVPPPAAEPKAPPSGGNN